MSNPFHVYKKAGVRPSDVATLLSVTRVTVSHWFNDHSQPHRILEKRVARLHKAVAEAVKLGKLPVSRDVPRSDRFSTIKRIIEETLHTLKLGSIDD